MNATTETQIETLFSLLDNWRKLPAYQLERRADIFFALYLPDIINQKFDDNITHQHIIPEFPVKKNNSNLSNKIDYAVVSEKKKRVYLIELKTDTSSLNKAQNEYLKKAKDKGTEVLVKNIETISNASKSEKYDNLLSRLKKLEFADIANIEIVYILPNKEIKGVLDGTKIIDFSDIVEIIENKNDGLTKRFIESLKNWKD